MISVIIPTYNEAAALVGTVAALRQTGSPHEIMVVDGCSDDSTRVVASQLGLRVITGERAQRAAQLNLGASQSSGDVLLFLHADTILPPQALERIGEAVSHPRCGGGAFARRFDSPSLFLKFTCALAEFRNRAIGWHLGDQAIFVRKALFDQLEGFRLYDRFEDLDFSRRLGSLTDLATLRPPVRSSARRFARAGPFQQTMRDFILTMHYLVGSPAALYSSGVARNDIEGNKNKDAF